jgi:hypothetical protein
MTVSQVGATQTSTTTGSPSQVMNKPAGVAAGDLILACWVAFNATAPTCASPGTNWVRKYQRTDAGQGWGHEIWLKVVDGSEGSTFTFTADGGTSNAVVLWAIRSNVRSFTTVNEAWDNVNVAKIGLAVAQVTTNELYPRNAPGVVYLFATNSFGLAFSFDGTPWPNPAMTNIGQASSGWTMQVCTNNYSNTNTIATETVNCSAATGSILALLFSIKEPTSPATGGWLRA